MKLNFVKASPSQNMTVLITNYVAPVHYAEVANIIMGYEYLNAEQVGFIVPPKTSNSILRLEMSGGEFCGNAVLSAAAYSCYKGLSDKKNFFLEASGTETPLACEVKVKSPSHFEARAEMPHPLSIKDMSIQLDRNMIHGSIVQLDGITHFLTDHWLHEEEYESVLEELTGKIDDKAIGIIPYKKLAEQDYEIRPFVYVEETGSKFFERACGSGTLALGIHLAQENQDQPLTVHQPGGIIHVETGEKNSISTNVRFTCEGIVEFDPLF
ncbi:hypothetical protein [Pseudobacillus wudalianchiensis]|uniref:Diaminopimelate epimerase n=1 Tax=Pseudobacillus wudalianchiensis TaxID=1743143 RepID=A0A1B9AAF1_9BACI|nr:hypothetical protein [Bacillus wudalianchiensis]OCA80818.1 hypothetical protein A8F95_17060 [Bacillus wudalianchiensis]